MIGRNLAGRLKQLEARFERTSQPERIIRISYVDREGEVTSTLTLGPNGARTWTDLEDPANPRTWTESAPTQAKPWERG